MKKFRAFCLTLATLTASFSDSPLASTEPATALRSNVSFNDVLKVPFAKPDSRIAYADASVQFVDHWQAHADHASTPVLISIHGGCWLNAYAIDHTYAMNSALRDAGFAVWSIEYRRIGDDGGGWPGTFDDVQAALTRVADEYGGADAFKQRDVTLIGHSAGGHLALLAAAQNPQLIDRVVGLAAITDIATYAAGENSCQQAGKSFMAQASTESWQLANPAQQELTVPAYLFHGDADRIVPQQQSAGFAEQKKASVEWLEGAGHFDVIDPKSRAWLTIVTKLKALSSEN